MSTEVSISSERDQHEDVTLCIHIKSQLHQELVTRQEWKAVLEHYRILRTWGVERVHASAACRILVIGLGK